MPPIHLYLASASPRRAQLLQQIGVSFQRLSVTLDETPRADESPNDYVLRLALAKARAGWESLGDRPLLPVLGADTAVVVDDTILGKPKDRAQGLAMLALLSGREHSVISVVALMQGQHEACRVQCSRVLFRSLSHQECETYWDTGESVDKAGAYAIQGRGGVFVRDLKGSYSGVMGLPLFETCELLQEFDIHIL